MAEIVLHPMFVLSVWQRGRSKQSSNIHIPEAPLLPSHPNLLSLLCTLGHKAVHNINYNDFRINSIGWCYNDFFFYLEHVADVRERGSQIEMIPECSTALAGFSQSINSRALPLTTHPSVPP